MLDRLSQRLENPGLDTETSNLHNTTVSVLLYYLEMLNVADLREAYTKISGTSYKEETIRYSATQIILANLVFHVLFHSFIIILEICFLKLFHKLAQKSLHYLY